MKQTERTLARRNLARRSGSSVLKDAYVIQAVLPDGFTYWYAGLGDIQVGEQTLKGDKWSPYYHDAIKGPRDMVEKVLETVLKDNVNSPVMLPILEAAWDKAFDLYPANLTKYMEYEVAEREKTTAGLKAIDEPFACDSCGTNTVNYEGAICTICSQPLPTDTDEAIPEKTDGQEIPS